MKKAILLAAIVLSACSPSSSQQHQTETLQPPARFSNIADWDGADKLISISGFKPVTTTMTTDDGCKIKRLVFESESKPASNLEFKCNKINIYWTQFEEAEFSADNEQALNKASKFTAILSGSPDFVSRAMHGEIFDGDITPAGYKINGSCQSDTCLLSLTQ